MDRDESMKLGEYEGYVIRDEDTTNPRKAFDNFGRMVCGHRRYSMGDDFSFNPDYFDSWAEVEKYYRDNEDAAVILPVYLLDHSGLSVSTKPFSCHYDSGRIGFIYATAAAVLEHFPASAVPSESDAFEAARKRLEAEVETYDAYLSGNVHGWQIVDANGEHVDSCFGYYGDEGRKLAAEDMRRELEALAGRAARQESERAHYATEC